MSEYTTDHDLKAYEDMSCGYECHYTEEYGFVPEAGCPIHDICKHQFIEGDFNCVLCGNTIITTTGNVGPGTTQPTAKLKVKNMIANKWWDRLKLATIITNSFEGQCQMEMFNVGFVKQLISNILKEKTEEILKVKEAVRRQTGSFKYDDCYDDCIKIISK